MNDKRKTWIMPRAEIEEFTPNEYVSSCWGVGCSVKIANQIEKDKGLYNPGILDHGEKHCGFSGNQVIYDDDNNGTVDRMTEIGTDGLGTLNCTIYTDGNYSTIRPISSVNPGDIIYWTTSAGDKTWHHVGTVYETVPGHPNRS